MLTPGGRSQSSGEAPVQGSGEDLSLASSQSALVVSCWRDDPEEGSEEALDQGLCASDDDVSEVRPGDSDDQDEGPSVDDWEHAVDQMFVLVCKQQACADRSPCLAFDPFQDSPGERRARGLPSSQAKLVAPEPCARTRTTLNPSESLLHEYIARHGLSTMQINGLLAMVQNPLFVRELVSFQSAVGYRSRVDRTVASTLQQVNLRLESASTMDGTDLWKTLLRKWCNRPSTLGECTGHFAGQWINSLGTECLPALQTVCGLRACLVRSRARLERTRTWSRLS